MNSEKNNRNQKRKKLCNRSQTWDKTKPYQNSKLSERGIWFDVWENFFFLLSFSCVRITFRFQSIGVLFSFLFFFFFLFLCQSPLRLQLDIQGNFRWSQGGQVPPFAPHWLRRHYSKITRSKSQQKINQISRNLTNHQKITQINRNLTNHQKIIHSHADLAATTTTK